MDSCLSIKNLTKHYDTFTLDGVSFELPKGSIMGFVGENGAGKSTTINAILNLIKKDGGNVRFGDKELSEYPELKEEIGVVFDEINFYEKLTPKKVGKILSLSYKSWDGELYKDYLKRLSLPENKEIKSFSKGMKRKLCIVTALSHRPKLLILDEPTNGLDPIMRDDILDIFLEFVQDENHSILLSSHITSDLEKIADYITFIHGGKILFSKSKDELKYSYGIIRCTKEQFETIKKDDIISYRKEEYQYSVLICDKEDARKKYPSFIIDNTTIDEILLIYVKGEKII